MSFTDAAPYSYGSCVERVRQRNAMEINLVEGWSQIEERASALSEARSPQYRGDR